MSYLFPDQIRNDRSRVGHDVDGVVRLAFAGELGFGELPCFFYGSRRELAGLFDGFKIFFSRHEVDRVTVGHAEEVERYEEGDGKFSLQVCVPFSNPNVNVFIPIGGPPLRLLEISSLPLIAVCRYSIDLGGRFPSKNGRCLQKIFRRHRLFYFEHRMYFLPVREVIFSKAGLDCAAP